MKTFVAKRSPYFAQISQLCATPLFVFLTVMFLCGVMAGSFTGIRAAQMETETVQQLVETVQQGASWGVLLVGGMVPALCWQLAAVLGGYFGSLAVSGVLAARGFVLAFSVGALLQTWGWQGLVASLASSGLGAVIGVPCLLLCGTIVLMAGLERPRNGRKSGYAYALQRYRGVLLMSTLLHLLSGILRVPLLILLDYWEILA